MRRLSIVVAVAAVSAACLVTTSPPANPAPQAVHVHLEQPVAGVDPALQEEQVMQGRRFDMGDSAAVLYQPGRRLQARQRSGGRGLGRRCRFRGRRRGNGEQSEESEDAEGACQGKG